MGDINGIAVKFNFWYNIYMNRKYCINANVFKGCDTPETAYWIGFLMADGSIRQNKNNYTLRLGLSGKDINHLMKFQAFIETTAPIFTYKYRNYTKVTLEIHGKELIYSLKKYGLAPRKTGKEQIKNIPKKYHSDFIRGYFDGDGCLSKDIRGNKKRHSLCFTVACASKKFLKTLQNILIKNCLLSSTKILPISDNCYHLKYGGNKQIPRIFDYLLKNSGTKLERKYKILSEI